MVTKGGVDGLYVHIDRPLFIPVIRSEFSSVVGNLKNLAVCCSYQGFCPTQTRVDVPDILMMGAGCTVGGGDDAGWRNWAA